MKTISVITIAVLLVGCGQDAAYPSAKTPPGSPAPSDRLAEAERRPADNSGKNVRDDGTTATPLDQGQSGDDLRITKSIRAAITDREGMSLNARNIKIITRDRVVTLRGPVDKPEERQWIVATASAVPGVTRVDDRIELTAR